MFKIFIIKLYSNKYLYHIEDTYLIYEKLLNIIINKIYI